MKIKTSELTGAALDWAVAKCEGIQDSDNGLPRRYPCHIMKPFIECLAVAAFLALPLILYFWRMTP